MTKYILIALFSIQSMADIYELKPEYLQTSDGFYFSRLAVDYSGFRSDTWWPYINEPETGAGWTAHATVVQADTPQDNIGSYKLRLGIHNKRSKRNSWTMNVGLVQVSEKSRDDYLDTLFYIQSKGFWTSHSWYSFEAYKDYLFMERLVLTGPQDQVRSYGIKPSFLFNGWTKQRIFFRGNYSHMDHDNLRTESDLQWMYGLSHYQPWLWVGAGVNHLTFKNPSNGYWSPDQFLSWGPRSEISYSFGRLEVSAAFNYNIFKESTFDQGEGYYSSVSVQYGRRESNHIRLTGTAMESAQGTSAWRASSLMLSTLIQF